MVDEASVSTLAATADSFALSFTAPRYGSWGCAATIRALGEPNAAQREGV